MSQTNHNAAESNTSGPAYISISATVKNKFFCCISSTENRDVNNNKIKINEVDPDPGIDIQEKTEKEEEIPITPQLQ